MRAWATFKENAATWIAFHLPRRVAYWATIRLGANATTGPHSGQIVPDLTFLDALERW
jgi:hypothetical protein